MENHLSKSEKKRRSKSIEKLVLELVELTGKDLESLPCEPFIQDEIGKAKTLKSSARKRQIKYIAKMLRQDARVEAELLYFLQKNKGSKLQKVSEYHELERLRDAIIDEVIALYDKARADGKIPYQVHIEGGYGKAVSEAVRRFPGLAAEDLQKSAFQFARTRKIIHSREIFRMLRSALEQQKYVISD